MLLLEDYRAYNDECQKPYEAELCAGSQEGAGWGQADVFFVKIDMKILLLEENSVKQ